MIVALYERLAARFGWSWWRDPYAAPVGDGAAPATWPSVAVSRHDIPMLVSDIGSAFADASLIDSEPRAADEALAEFEARAAADIAAERARITGDAAGQPEWRVLQHLADLTTRHDPYTAARILFGDTP